MTDHDGEARATAASSAGCILTDRPRARPRLRDLDTRHPAGDAVRGRGLCAFLPRANACSRRWPLRLTELFSPHDHRRAHRRACWRITISSPRTRSPISAAPAAGAARCRFRARLREASTRAPWPSSRASSTRSKFKCNVLWAQLDALWHAYVEARSRPAPGAGRIEAK